MDWSDLLTPFINYIHKVIEAWVPGIFLFSFLFVIGGLFIAAEKTREFLRKTFSRGSPPEIQESPILQVQAAQEEPSSHEVDAGPPSPPTPKRIPTLNPRIMLTRMGFRRARLPNGRMALFRVASCENCGRLMCHDYDVVATEEDETEWSVVPLADPPSLRGGMSHVHAPLLCEDCLKSSWAS